MDDDKTRTTESIEDLEARLAAKQDARKGKTKAVDEKVRRRELEGRLKLEEMAEEHGELGRDFDAVFSPRNGDMVAVKAPRGMAYQRFRARMLSPKGVTEQDMYQLLRACLLSPPDGELEAVLDASPGLMDAAIAKITDLAGNRAETGAGK